VPFGWLESALAQKAPNMADLFVVVERVMPVMRCSEGHLFPAQLHLQMFLLRLFGGASESLEHVNDITPVNVV